MDTKQNILKYLLTEGDIDPFSPKITKKQYDRDIRTVKYQSNSG